MSKNFKVLTENEIFLISGGKRCTDNSRERAREKTRTQKQIERITKERDRLIRERYGRTASAFEAGFRAWNGGLSCADF